MKGKKFYFILVGLITVGVVSLIIFRRQQEEKYIAFEGYEITAITDRVDELYNEDKTDIVKDISDEQLEEIDSILLELKEKDFSSENEHLLQEAELDYLMARDMNVLEAKINELFIEDEIIDQHSTIGQVEELKEELDNYEMTSLFFERNTETLENAHHQTEVIETARNFIDDLFEEEEVVRGDITREDEAEALRLIEQIKNQVVREELTGRIEIVDVTLTEIEEAKLLEAELEALEEEISEEELEEDETEIIDEEIEEEFEHTDTTPNDEWDSETSTNSWSSPRNSDTNASGNDTDSGNSNYQTGGDTSNTEGNTNDTEPIEGYEEEDNTEDTGDMNNDEKVEPEEQRPENPEAPEEPDEPIDSENTYETDEEQDEET